MFSFLSKPAPAPVFIFTVDPTRAKIRAVVSTAAIGTALLYKIVPFVSTWISIKASFLNSYNPYFLYKKMVYKSTLITKTGFGAELLNQKLRLTPFSKYAAFHSEYI